MIDWPQASQQRPSVWVTAFCVKTRRLDQEKCSFLPGIWGSRGFPEVASESFSFRRCNTTAMQFQVFGLLEL